jgi:hypothetical protein
VHEASEVVLGCDLLSNLHDHEVLVDLGGDIAEHGGELVLVGGNLPEQARVRKCDCKTLHGSVRQFSHSSTLCTLATVCTMHACSLAFGISESLKADQSRT